MRVVAALTRNMLGLYDACTQQTVQTRTRIKVKSTCEPPDTRFLSRFQQLTVIVKDTGQRHDQFLSNVIDMERPRPQQSRPVNDILPQSGKRAVQCAEHEKPERHIMVESEQPESASIPTHFLLPNADLWPSQNRRLSLIAARILPRTHRPLIFGS